MDQYPTPRSCPGRDQPGSGAEGEPAERRQAPGRRIVVVGTTGSGKTTLAGQLATRLGVLHVELDALHWDANWTPAPPEIFRQRTAAALAADGWVVDGNYHAVRDLIWRRAETIVWLDYALRVNLWRLLRRSLRRVVRGTELWNGNRETFRTQFLSRDSLFLWAVDTHRRRPRQLPSLLQLPEHGHLRVVHLFSPQATERWVLGIDERAGNGNRTRAFSLGS